MNLRQEELGGVLARLDALATQPADLLAHLRRVLRLADRDEQLPELGHLSVQLANHLPGRSTHGNTALHLSFVMRNAPQSITPRSAQLVPLQASN